MCSAPKMPKMEPIAMPTPAPPPPPPPSMVAETDAAKVKTPSTRARRRQASRGPSSLSIPLAKASTPNIPT